MLLKAGINSVEFWVETPDFWMNRGDETSVVILEEALSVMQGGCTFHAPVLDLNPSSINEHVHEITIKETLWCLEIAKILNARAVTIHPGRRTVHRPPVDEDWEKFFKYLRICKRKADELDLKLSLENSMPAISSMCSSMNEMKEVLDKFPGLFFTFDIAHACMHSQKRALAFIEELGDRMINVHVATPHNGKHSPSHHNKNMDKVLLALRDSGYDGDLTIEIDDKVYPMPLSKKDKIKELRDEREYLERIFG